MLSKKRGFFGSSRNRAGARRARHGRGDGPDDKRRARGEADDGAAVPRPQRSQGSDRRLDATNPDDVTYNRPLEDFQKQLRHLHQRSQGGDAGYVAQEPISDRRLSVGSSLSKFRHHWGTN